MEPILKSEPMDVDETIEIKTEPEDNLPVIVKEESLAGVSAEALRGIGTKQEVRPYCNVYGCLVNSVSCPEYSLFTLPVDPFRRRAWLRLIDREDLLDPSNVNIYICEKHFRDEDIISTSRRKFPKKKAIPSLSLPGTKQTPTKTNIEICTCDKAVLARPELSHITTQTYETMAGRDSSIQVDFETADDFKKRIKSKLFLARRRLRCAERELESTKKEQFCSACDRIMPPFLAELVKCQTELKYSSTGNRYSFEHRVFSLNLFFVSKKVYRMIEDDFCLPSMTSLQAMDVPVSTNFSDDLMAALKIKVKNMSDSEKYCVVAVDTIRLKGNLFYNSRLDRIIGLHEINGSQKPIPAQYALVVIVRGLFVDWVQPIGFAFLSETKFTEDVSIWMDQVLEKLLQTGLKIKAYIPTFMTELVDEAKIRCIRVDRPYFYIQDVKIYYIFNVPDLMQQLRNTFLTHDFQYQRAGGSVGVAKSDHVRNFYQKDQEKTLKMAPKLTQSHLQARGLGRKSVRYAAQMFSKTVATALSVYTDYNKLQQSTRETIEVLALINDLFDVLNSSSVSDDPFKTVFTGVSHQKNILIRGLGFFKSLKISHAKSGQDPTVNVDFIRSFQVTINAVNYLSEDLKSEGYNSLLTRRLTLDVTDRAFKMIRSKGDMTVEPTSHQFVMAFRKLYFTHLLKPTAGGHSCSKDLTKLLVNLTNFTGFDDANEAYACSKEGPCNEMRAKYLTTSKFHKIKVGETNRMRDICSFLLELCSNVKQHKNCGTITVFTKMYNTGKYDNEPTIMMFVDFVAMMENKFQRSFDRINCRDLMLGSSVYESIKAAEFVPPCPCFPTTFCQKIFVRLRLHMTQKYNNLLYHESRYKGKQFVVPKLTE